MPSLNTFRLTWVSLTSDGGISSRLLQQSAAAVPYFGRGYLLTAAPPDLKRRVAPLSPPVPGSSRSLEVELLLSHRTTVLFNSMKLIHVVWGHPRWSGHGGEV